MGIIKSHTWWGTNPSISWGPLLSLLPLQGSLQARLGECTLGGCPVKQLLWRYLETDCPAASVGLTELTLVPILTHTEIPVLIPKSDTSRTDRPRPNGPGSWLNLQNPHFTCRINMISRLLSSSLPQPSCTMDVSTSSLLIYFYLHIWYWVTAYGW